MDIFKLLGQNINFYKIYEYLVIKINWDIKNPDSTAHYNGEMEFVIILI